RGVPSGTHCAANRTPLSMRLLPAFGGIGVPQLKPRSSMCAWKAMAVCGSQRSASTDELVVQVDRRLDRRVGLPRTPLLAGQDPGDLECVAVGVSAVDRLRGTVICLALEAAFGGEPVARAHEVAKVVDLPRTVEQTHG